MTSRNVLRLGLGATVLIAGSLAFYAVTSAPPAVGNWTQAGQAPVACFEAMSTVVDGRLYRFGGFDRELKATVGSSCFDPQTEAWSAIADLPTPVTHVNAAIDGNSLWIAGGFVGDDPGTSTDAVWKYDLEGDTWETGPPLPVVRAGGGLVRLGRKLHYFGGFGADRDEVHGDHFTLDLDGGATWTKLAPLPVARGHVGGAVVGGRIFAIGGQLRHDTDPLDLDLVHAYDIEANRWEACATLPTARSHCEQSTFVLGDRIVVMGGRDTARQRGRFMRSRNPFAPLDAVTVYRTAEDAWTEGPRLPVGLLGPSAHVLGDRVLLIGGSVDGPWKPQTAQYSLGLDELP